MVLYALAAAGGAIAYVPFLTILLPLRVAALAGTSDVEWLAYLTFAGAISASLGHIAFGWLSDVTKSRRPWIVTGLIASSVLLGCFGLVERIEALIALVCLWQLALNMMLGPLSAWAADCVPDHQKGLLGGLLAFSPALGALSSAFVTLPNLAAWDGRLWLVSALVMLCVLPVLLFGNPVRFAELAPSASAPPTVRLIDLPARKLLVRMWLARLLVQVSEAALFAYLYFWFRSIDPAMGGHVTAQIFGVVLVAAVPLALLTGRWADVHHRPIMPLAVCAVLSSVGLFAMALSSSLVTALVGYILFGLATTVFLSLHTSQTMAVLPRAERRGRDLGLFNLTNTVPSLAMPWIVLALVPVFGFGPLLAVLGVLALIAAILLASSSSAR